MLTSQTVTKMTKALVKFHLDVSTISKDSDNPFFKSKFASLPNILDAIKTPLHHSGLTFVQFPTTDFGLTTRIMCEDEWMEDTFKMTPVKNDPQGIGSAITYQRRYALCAILGLSTDDDDGNEASGLNNKIVEKQNTTPVGTSTVSTFKPSVGEAKMSVGQKNYVNTLVKRLGMTDKQFTFVFKSTLKDVSDCSLSMSDVKGIIDMLKDAKSLDEIIGSEPETTAFATEVIKDPILLKDLQASLKDMDKTHPDYKKTTDAIAKLTT